MPQGKDIKASIWKGKIEPKARDQTVASAVQYEFLSDAIVTFYEDDMSPFFLRFITVLSVLPNRT